MVLNRSCLFPRVIDCPISNTCRDSGRVIGKHRAGTLSTCQLSGSADASTLEELVPKNHHVGHDGTWGAPTLFLFSHATSSLPDSMASNQLG